MSDSVENPNIRHYTAEDVKRLDQLVKDGVTIEQEIEDLREGLNDTIKSIAEEIGVKPAQLKKVIRIVHKNNLHEETGKMEEIVDILETIGRA